MRTGTRCTTFTKLPDALSAAAARSARRCRRRGSRPCPRTCGPGTRRCSISARWPGRISPTCVSLKLATTYVAGRHQLGDRLARADELARRAPTSLDATPSAGATTCVYASWSLRQRRARPPRSSRARGPGRRWRCAAAICASTGALCSTRPSRLADAALRGALAAPRRAASCACACASAACAESSAACALSSRSCGIGVRPAAAPWRASRSSSALCASACARVSAARGAAICASAPLTPTVDPGQRRLRAGEAALATSASTICDLRVGRGGLRLRGRELGLGLLHARLVVGAGRSRRARRPSSPAGCRRRARCDHAPPTRAAIGTTSAVDLRVVGALLPGRDDAVDADAAAAATTPTIARG